MLVFAQLSRSASVFSLAAVDLMTWVVTLNGDTFDEEDDEENGGGEDAT